VLQADVINAIIDGKVQSAAQGGTKSALNVEEENTAGTGQRENPTI